MKRATFTGRVLPVRLRHIAEREAEYLRKPIAVHAMKCSRGCEHGYARSDWGGGGRIRLYMAVQVRTAYLLGYRGKELKTAMFDNDLNRFLLIHELAHIASGYSGHDYYFHVQAIRIAKRERCLRGFLNWQGRAATAAYRSMRKRAVAA